MKMDLYAVALQADRTAEAVDAAIRAIPPLWPLSASVAVNPYLGQARMTLAEAGARLARTAGAPVTLPRAWYRDRIASGAISDADLEAALAAAPEALRPANFAALKAAAETPAQAPQAAPTVAELAAQASGTDWPGLIDDRIGAWAAARFDEGQALWSAPRGPGAYAAWRAFALRDLTAEIAGLPGFAAHVSAAPERAQELIARASLGLGLSDAALERYFHRLLVTLGGWSQYARHLLWKAELAGGTDDTAMDLLAIRLAWEEALFERHRDRIAKDWDEAKAAYAAPDAPTADLALDAILQEAAERADQRALVAQLAAPAPQRTQARPTLHAVFCIDVRSERFRRALEGVDPTIRTSGFAGFFGVAAQHRRFASDVPEHRLPVLLNPAVTSRAGGAPEADLRTRHARRATRAWGRFKLAAVSSFAFVEATGPVYVGKLVRDALGLGHGAQAQDPAPQLTPGLDAKARTDAAETVLRAMSMTQDFARIVLLAGHGASAVNNPYASALHCGACGGHSGEANARLLAALLNDADVRRGLADRGIEIPRDTQFLAGLHDTTTDDVRLFDGDHPAPAPQDLDRARAWLATAGARVRVERALTLPGARSEADVIRRSRDWSEIRPEWALAGCRAFIAAPRDRTAGRDLDGRVFLHDYDWTRDGGFRVLELILTAPVVVASWISLQYYGSTVAPEVFGAGDKLLHNVTGGIGVVEGNGGRLRPGLPLQSVHDGERPRHEPLRLCVCVEAPREAMTDILRRHPDVRTLFDNRWLHLLAMDEGGRLAWRYRGDLDWSEEAPAEEAKLPEAD